MFLLVNLPQPLHEHVVRRTPSDVHAHRHSALSRHPVNAAANRPPGSVLKTSGLPLSRPLQAFSGQNGPSGMFDSRHATTYRLYHAITTARYMNPAVIGS